MEICLYRSSPWEVLSRTIMWAWVGALLSCGGSWAQDYGTTDAVELEAMYEILSGINSGTDWKSKLPDPCNSWQQGIFCMYDDAGHLHVTNLEFGTLSKTIEIIPCTSNSSLHPSIAKLPYLQTLQIFNCFTNRPVSIPKEIASLGDLQILTFQGNPALVGSLPVETGQLKSLQRLSVTRCGIAGPIPAEIGNLSNVREVDLSRNRLDGEVPPSLNLLSNLQVLDLEGNLLSGGLPPLGDLRKLEKMVLRNNALNASIPEWIGQLTSLKYLDLNDNRFSGVIPSSFDQLNNLQDFYLERNDMRTQIPAFLGSMPKLSRLSCAESNFLGEIPPGLAESTSIQFLLLYGNSLTGPIPPGLELMTSLYYLDLSSNNLTGAVPFSVKFQEKMGGNLKFSNNTELCYPHSASRKALVAGMGACALSIEEPISVGVEADPPTANPSASTSGSFSPRLRVMFITPILIGVLSLLAIA